MRWPERPAKARWCWAKFCGDRSITPSPGQRIAVRQQQNIRPLNDHTDSDDVVRRLPLTFAIDGAKMPTMAVELAARALGTAPQFDERGRMTLAGYRVPGRVPNTMTLNFEGGADDIPTFSFADLRACAVKNDKDYFRRWFDGKVVIFGTVLDIEDRRMTSKRFATGIEGARAPRCAAESTPVTAGSRTSTIAGVYVHATAVNNLIARNAVVEPGPLARLSIAALIAALAAAAAWLFRPVVAFFAWTAMIALGVAGATVAFNYALALPVVEPILASLAALAATIGFRFVIADKDRRLLQKSFALYLAPHVINRMLSSNKLPELGGETRNVTVFFSDIEGFSLIAEKMSPDDLMSLMNEYLSAMTDVIESHGGYVDKYIGDFDRGGVRRAGRRSRSCRQCGACGAGLLHATGRTQRVFGPLPRKQAGATDRHQFRRGAGRQFRIAAALQLLGHERRGEPGFAAGGRE